MGDLLSIGALLLSVCVHAECPKFTKYTWQLDLGAKSLKRLGRAPRAVALCNPLPLSGEENALFELIERRGSKVVFARKIFLNTLLHYDYLDSAGQLAGGAREDKHPILTTLVPDSGAGSGPFTVRITSLENRRPLASGEL